MKFYECHVNGQDEIVVCAWKSSLYIKAGGVCMYLFMYACFNSVGISCRISAMILICSSILGSSYQTLYNLWRTTGCNDVIKVCISERFDCRLFQKWARFSSLWSNYKGLFDLLWPSFFSCCKKFCSVLILLKILEFIVVHL